HRAETARSAPSRLAIRATLAPCADSSSPRAAPIPPLPPVIATTLSCTSTSLYPQDRPSRGAYAEVPSYGGVRSANQPPHSVLRRSAVALAKAEASRCVESKLL